MTPRPYRPDPTRRVEFGYWPLAADEGIVPRVMPYRINPPDPRKGVTLVTRKRGTEYYKKLRRTDWLSQQEAAAFLRVHRTQVNRWVRSGKLPDRKILGTSRIQVGALVRFLKASKRTKLVPYLIG